MGGGTTVEILAEDVNDDEEEVGNEIENAPEARDAATNSFGLILIHEHI